MSTPAGMSTVYDFSVTSRPSPLQVVHGSAITSPAPRQMGHGAAVTMPGETPQVPYQQTAQPAYSQYGR